MEIQKLKEELYKIKEELYCLMLDVDGVPEGETQSYDQLKQKVKLTTEVVWGIWESIEDEEESI